MRSWWLAVVVGMVSACGVETQFNSDVKSSSEQEWTTFRNSARFISEANAYLVDGDVLVRQQELRRYFDEGSTSTALTVRQTLAQHVDDIWPQSIRNNIRYCISNTWGGVTKQAVVNAMSMAAATWGAGANLRFVYVPSQDAACNGSNTSVELNVLQADLGGALAAATFPSDEQDPAAGRQLFIALAGQQSVSPPLTGVLRHELGHVLGLRHENIRFTNNCAETALMDPSRAVNTADLASVMITPACTPGPSFGNPNLNLSNLDHEGIILLYGAAATIDAGVPSVDAGVPDAGTPFRIGVITSSGDVFVKEGAVNALWTWESYGARKLVLAGSRIGVLSNDGNLFIKSGALNADWTWMAADVVDFDLDTNRVGIVQTHLAPGGVPGQVDYLVKEGSLSSLWVTVNGAQSIQGGPLPQISTTNSRIGVVLPFRASDGGVTASVMVKDYAAPYWAQIIEGKKAIVTDTRFMALTMDDQAYLIDWSLGQSPFLNPGHFVSWDVKDIALSGTRFGVVNSAVRDFNVKDGAWNASWTWMSSSVSSPALGRASRIGVVSGTDAYVKEGAFTASWVWQSGPATSIVLSK